jgi:small subunit ribosomal protein S1
MSNDISSNNDIKQNENIDFEKAYMDSFKDIQEDSIIQATVVDISNDTVFLDFGFKSEAKILCSEFETLPKIGDNIDIYIIRLEGKNGEPVVSKKRCDYLNEKKELVAIWKERKIIKGNIKNIKRSGVVVEYKNVTGFIPNSLFDFNKDQDLKDYLNKEVSFYIEKIYFKDNNFQQKSNRQEEEFLGNRKKYLYEKNNKMRDSFFDEKNEGDVIEGKVKSLTDFGAFIDLGSIDALLRNKDASWHRIKDVSEVVSEGQTVKVKILKIDKELRRLTVGLKQLQEDPWDIFVKEYKVDDKIVGSVTSITTYGAFVKIIDGVEGLLHVSDMSWIQKIKSPTELVKTGQNLELKILKIDKTNRKVSLSLKHLLDNPWDSVKEKYKEGTIIKGKIKSITTFGVFIELEEGIDALLHIDDVSWIETIRNPYERFNVGDEIEAVVTICDPKNNKIRISVKDLTEDPWKKIKELYKAGDIITCKVEKIDEEKGLLVKLTDDISTYIPLNHIGLGKRYDIKANLKSTYNIDDEVKAIITSLDLKKRRIAISIKEYIKKMEKDKVKAFLHDIEEDSKFTLKDAIKHKK